MPARPENPQIALEKILDTFNFPGFTPQTRMSLLMGIVEELGKRHKDFTPEQAREITALIRASFNRDSE